MKCDDYNHKRCFSCQWLNEAYSHQLHKKQQNMLDKLAIFSPKNIFSPIASQTSGFRNKAKMAVVGTVENPKLGIVKADNSILDLCHCPLYSKKMQKVLVQIKDFIRQLKLIPYNINKCKGELKFIIVTESKNQFMLRFVLRSGRYISLLQEAITQLQNDIPELSVISANIQPIHAAILEGEEEHILTAQHQLMVELNHVPLFIQPKSFFQTNTQVAEKLYQTAKNWLEPYDVTLIWDLFCGVGGFGLHCVEPQTKLVGIEINQEAIVCANMSAKQLGLSNVTFHSLDSALFASANCCQTPDVILVNPPRRGLGVSLVETISALSPKHIIYSSCNLESLFFDLQKICQSYQLLHVQLFDMFPHTHHMEIMVLLQQTER